MDIKAAAAAEVGAIFATIVLVTGPLWAKPVWGIWWTWDPRSDFDVRPLVDLSGLHDAPTPD